MKAKGSVIVVISRYAENDSTPTLVGVYDSTEAYEEGMRKLFFSSLLNFSLKKFGFFKNSL